MPTWRTKEGDLDVRDMTTSHIVHCVAFLRRRAEAKRADVEDGRADEIEADRYLSWAQSWFKTFEEELARREAEAAQSDQRLQSKELTEMLTDPGEVDDEIELG